MKSFYRLYAAQLISLTGTTMNSVVSMFWIYSLTGSVARSVLSAVFCLLAKTAVSLAFSSAIDRGEKKKYVLMGEVFQFFVFLGLFFMAKYDIKNIYLVYVLQMLIGGVAAVYGPARSAWQLEYVRGAYAKIAGGIYSANNFISILCMAAGGCLAKHVPFYAFFLYNALTFALAFVIELSVEEPASGGIGPAKRPEDFFAGLKKEFMECLEYVKRDEKELLSLIRLFILINMLSAPLATFIPLLIKVGFDLGASVYGLVLMLGTLGSLIGGLIPAKLKRSPGGIGAIPCIIAGSSLLTAAVYVSSSFWVLAAILLVSGVVGGVISVSMSIAFSRIDSRHYCKVTGFFENISGALIPFGLITLSYVSSNYGIRAPFLLSGVCSFVVCVFFYMRHSPARERKTVLAD